MSVLDLCKRSRTEGARHSLEETLDLACLAESLGYKRFWIAEHHTDDAAQSSPEVLLPLLAARTKSIRIGAGGILLQYYSPLKVAEVFIALEALFPRRLDCGICRGTGVNSPETALALVSGHQDELSEQTFDQKVRDVVALLRTSSNGAGRDDAVRPRPLGVRPPPVWVLGASPRSVRLAASLGTPYAYSLFFGGGLSYGLDLMAEYRRAFVPSAEHRAACGMIAVSVMCAESEASAIRYDAKLVEQGCYKSNIVGTPRQCAQMLRVFAQAFGVDEIIAATFTRDYAQRRNLYKWLAEELRG